MPSEFWTGFSVRFDEIPSSLSSPSSSQGNFYQLTTSVLGRMNKSKRKLTECSKCKILLSYYTTIIAFSTLFWPAVVVEHSSPNHGIGCFISSSSSPWPRHWNPLHSLINLNANKAFMILSLLYKGVYNVLKLSNLNLHFNSVEHTRLFDTIQNTAVDSPLILVNFHI